jgi:hypothetical protein
MLGNMGNSMDLGVAVCRLSSIVSETIIGVIVAPQGCRLDPSSLGMWARAILYPRWGL